MYRRKLITNPSSEPIASSELAEHTAVDENEDQAYLIRLIMRARRRFEHNTNRYLVAQTWQLAAARFVNVFSIAMGPLRSVTKIEYINTQGQVTLVDPSTYIVNDFGLQPTIEIAPNKSWPSDVIQQSNAVLITIEVGHAAVVNGNIASNNIIDSNMYELAKQAIMILAAHWYNNREDAAPVTITSMPHAYDALVAELAIEVL